MIQDRYNPCPYGIHVYSIHVLAIDKRIGVRTSEANYPHGTREDFYAMKASYGLAFDDDPDLIVELMVDGDTIDDFCIRRQSIAAIADMMKYRCEAPA